MAFFRQEVKPWVPGSWAAQRQSKGGTWDEEEGKKVERYEPLNQAQVAQLSSLTGDQSLWLVSC